MTEKEDKKPTEYTFEDILNPNFNEFVHNYNPEKFLLDEDGRIGFDVFKCKTIQEANSDSITNGRFPIFTIWENTVAFALAKVYCLYMNFTMTFGKCDKQVTELIKVLFHYQPKFHEFCEKYVQRIEILETTDIFFLNHPNRISTGDIKVVGNDREVIKTIQEYFDHLDDVCPLSKLVDAPDLDFDSKFDDITNIKSDDDIDDVVFNFKKTEP